MLRNTEFQRFDRVECYSVCSCLLYRSTVRQGSGRRTNKLWKRNNNNNNNNGQDRRSKLITYIYIYLFIHTYIYGKMSYVFIHNPQCTHKFVK